METHSNHALVGGVVLALFAGLAAFALWLGGFGGANMREYDVFFKSVPGLSKGSQVTILGVPSGEVKDIKLALNHPNLVRVRIRVNGDTPVLQGSTAEITTVGFTGAPLIALSGAKPGAPELTANGPEGRPVIPTRESPLDALMNSAPQLMNRLNTIADRLGAVLSPQNEKALTQILANMDTVSSGLASRRGEIMATIDEARVTMARANQAMVKIDGVANTADRLVKQDGPRISRNLDRTMAEAQQTLNTLDGLLGSAKPGLNRFSEETVPELNQIVQNLQETTGALNALIDQVDQQGAGSLLGGNKLPTYRGGK